MNHGDMLRKGESWFATITDDLVDVPPPLLKPSRIIHIRSQIIPVINEVNKEWSNNIAPM